VDIPLQALNLYFNGELKGPAHNDSAADQNAQSHIPWYLRSTLMFTYFSLRLGAQLASRLLIEREKVRYLLVVLHPGVDNNIRLARKFPPVGR
jgi:hypothetical protein